MAKTESTVKRRIAELRRYRTANKDVAQNQIACCVAYEIEHALRWTIEDVRGWPSPLMMAIQAAELIKKEVRGSEQARDQKEDRR